MTKEELDKQIKEVSDQLRDLIEQRKKAEYDGFYFVGKCIYLPGHGYMNVEMQNYEDEDNLISLTGKQFEYSKEEDYFYYDEHNTLTFSVNTFLSLVHFEEFKEISVEEFNEKLDEMMKAFVNRMLKNNYNKE